MLNSEFMKVEVMNTPDYIGEYPYTVARLCDGELWFYEAFMEHEKAIACCNEVGGIVLEKIV